jgi:hypothetical protein
VARRVGRRHVTVGEERVPALQPQMDT